jgi:hypothetical protein
MDRPVPDREVPEGYELVAVPEDSLRGGLEWRLATGMRCRMLTAGHCCKRPSVAEIDRGRTRPQWWAYCESHMFGRWVENGQVMTWILREIEDEPGSAR